MKKNFDTLREKDIGDVGTKNTSGITLIALAISRKCVRY